MNIRQSSKSSLFLVELIIAIFFFIIATTICIQLFVKSYTMSKETISLNHAVLWTQNLAEIFTNQHGNYNTLKNIYAENDCIQYTMLPQQDYLLLLFDDQWVITDSPANASYYLLSCHSKSNDFRYQDIFIMNNTMLDFSASHIDTLCNPNNIISYQRIQQFVPTNVGKE